MNETPMNMIQERIEELNRNLEVTEKKMKVQNKDYRKEMHRKFKKMPKVLDLCLRKHKKESLEISNNIEKLQKENFKIKR